MSEKDQPVERRPNPVRCFCGATTVLRILAWTSVLGVLWIWGIVLIEHLGPAGPGSHAWMLAVLGAAFVAGIASCCPLGGLGALLALLSLAASFAYAAGGASG